MRIRSIPKPGHLTRCSGRLRYDRIKPTSPSESCTDEKHGGRHLLAIAVLIILALSLLILAHHRHLVAGPGNH